MSGRAPQAEEQIVRAWFDLVKGNQRVAERYSPIRLLEVGTELNAYNPGTLGLAGFPVRPRELPSHSEDIAVDCYACPVFAVDETTRDSPLDAMSEFNEFRKLFFTKSSLPLRDSAGKSITDVGKFSFDWRRTVKPKEGVRIPLFVAHYESKIDPATGEFQ